MHKKKNEKEAKRSEYVELPLVWSPYWEKSIYNERETCEHGPVRVFISTSSIYILHRVSPLLAHLKMCFIQIAIYSLTIFNLVCKIFQRFYFMQKLFNLGFNMFHFVLVVYFFCHSVYGKPILKEYNSYHKMLKKDENIQIKTREK